MADSGPEVPLFRSAWRRLNSRSGKAAQKENCRLHPGGSRGGADADPRIAAIQPFPLEWLSLPNGHQAVAELVPRPRSAREGQHALVACRLPIIDVLLTAGDSAHRVAAGQRGQIGGGYERLLAQRGTVGIDR